MADLQINVDPSKVKMLDQMLLDLQTSFGAAPADLKVLATETTFAVHRLRNGLKRKFAEQVAQLFRDGDPDGGAEALGKFYPEFQIGDVEEILQLIYVDGTQDLQEAVAFVEKLSDQDIKKDAYEALYLDICFKGHTDLPEMLVLQRSLAAFQAAEETKKRVDEDCLKIVDSIVEIIRANDYSDDNKFVQSALRISLKQEMKSIVEKVHAAGTLEETLMLINFSQKLSNCCTLIQALFQVIKSKNLLDSEQAMHLWALAKFVKESYQFEDLDAEGQEKCLSTFTALDKNKEVYFQLYLCYVENADTKKIGALHKDNSHLLSFVLEIVDFYYDGDLKKVPVVLIALRNVRYYVPAHLGLTSLYKKMAQLQQLGTFECFAIFNTVKFFTAFGNFSSLSSSIKEPFEELQARAPPCLRLLLWPEPAGAKFRLVNKFFNFPLLCSDSKVFCGPSADQNDDPLWSAAVDLETYLTTFAIQEKSLSSQMESGTLTLTAGGTKWKVKANDDHHVKIYSEDGFLTANGPSAQDANTSVVCLKKENSTNMQLWRLEPVN